MTKSKYYDGTKLLSLKDINGKKPEIFAVSTNRTGGKTTFFTRMLINRYIKYGKKFGIQYRYKYECENCHEKIFKDVKGLFFKDWEMTSKSVEKGSFFELFLNGIPCGYCFPLNSAESIKRNSHYFSDIDSYIFDEFQSESGVYCNKEIDKFISIHDSIARGQGKQSRYVPVYMLSNPVTLLNPYYTSWGIASRIKKESKFVRGDGVVVEQGFVETAAEAARQSAFHRAFASENYVSYSQEGIYLIDNSAFIEKPKGNSYYLCTIKYKGQCFGIRQYNDLGILYCDTSYDETFYNKIAVTTDDHNVNFMLLNNGCLERDRFRRIFESGCFRFRNLACKEAVMAMCAYY